MKAIVIKSFMLCITTSLYAQWTWQETTIPMVVKDYAIQEIAIGNKNFIWALGRNQTNSTLFKWHQEKRMWEELANNITDVEAIAASKNNILFALQKQDRAAVLQAFNGNKWQEMYRIENARIGSLAAVDDKKVYAVINEKAYELSGETWRQLGSLEGFRQVSASSDGTLYARRFNFQAALDPETAFPAFSLEALAWNGTEWQKQDIRLAEKTTGIRSIAVQNKETIWCIVREDTAGGKTYKWLSLQQKLDLQGARTDLYTISASSDATIWAVSWAPEVVDRKVYVWTEVKEEKEEPKPSSAIQPTPLQPQQPPQTPVPAGVPVQPQTQGQVQQPTTAQQPPAATPSPAPAPPQPTTPTPAQPSPEVTSTDTTTHIVPPNSKIPPQT